MHLKLEWTIVVGSILLASCATMTSTEYGYQADRQAGAGDKSGAIESYNRALSASTEEYTTYKHLEKLAPLYEGMGNPQAAVKAYDNAIPKVSAKDNYYKLKYLLARGQIKARMKDGAGALADADLAVAAANPGSAIRGTSEAVYAAETYMARAAMHKAQGHLMQEMADYASAAELVRLTDRFSGDPGKKARDGLIDAIVRFETQAAATEGAQRPQGYSAYQQGKSKAESKTYLEAIGPLTDAIKASPDFAPAYYWRAISAIGLKDYKLALSDAEAALRLSPYQANNHYTRSVAREMTGNLDGALADIDRAMLIAWVPSSYQPQRESVLEKIEQRDHPQAYALMLSGQKKHGNKDYAGAIADYTAAIKLSPKFPDYYWRRAISESWGESTGYIERWRDDCSKAYLIDSRARYWIAKAQGDMAYATTFQTISLNLASIYHSAAFAYKQASELDASQGDDLLAKSNDAENRSRDTENRVRYPSSYSAQGNKAAAPTTTTVNLLRDKSRSRFLHDFVVIFSCPSTKDKRRYEVTADDQGQATNLAREHMNQGQWCGYNASFESATQVN